MHVAKRIRLAIIALLAFAGATAAQPEGNVIFIARDISDSSADQVLAAVTATLHLARGDDGQPLPPLTDAERAQPLLDRTLVKEVMDIGTASGVGEACGLDWQSLNFEPLMRRERARGDRTQHQLAAIAMTHGLMQAQVSRAGACGPNGTAAASAFYQRKWGAAH